MATDCAGTRSIERSHGPVSGPQEAMIKRKAVVKGTRDRSGPVNTGGERPYAAGWIGCCIECGEGAVGSPHEDTVIAPEGVSRNGFKIGSRDHPPGSCISLGGCEG